MSKRVAFLFMKFFAIFFGLVAASDVFTDESTFYYYNGAGFCTAPLATITSASASVSCSLVRRVSYERNICTFMFLSKRVSCYDDEGMSRTIYSYPLVPAATITFTHPIIARGFFDFVSANQTYPYTLQRGELYDIQNAAPYPSSVIYEAQQQDARSIYKMCSQQTDSDWFGLIYRESLYIVDKTKLATNMTISMVSAISCTRSGGEIFVFGNSGGQIEIHQFTYSDRALSWKRLDVSAGTNVPFVSDVIHLIRVQDKVVGYNPSSKLFSVFSMIYINPVNTSTMITSESAINSTMLPTNTEIPLVDTTIDQNMTIQNYAEPIKNDYAKLTLALIICVSIETVLLLGIGVFVLQRHLASKVKQQVNGNCPYAPPFNSIFQTFHPLAMSLKSKTIQTAKCGHALLSRYPPIKAFVYTLASASAIPIAAFTGYSATTLGGCLAVAGTGVAFVQGGFVLAGSFVLSWFILAALIIAAIVSFWFTAAYFAYSVAKKVEGV